MAEPQEAYSGPAMLLHWLVAIAVLAAAGLALFRESFARFLVEMTGLHEQVGLVVLLLALLRLGWRLKRRPPSFPLSVAPFERRIASAVHWLLYALLVAVPLSGWVFTSLAPGWRPLHYRGPDAVPRLPVATSDTAAFSWHEVHEVMGFALIGLVLLHLGAVARRSLAGERVILRMAAPGWPRLLFASAAAALALWLAGLAMDLFGVRLMGQPLPETIAPPSTARMPIG